MGRQLADVYPIARQTFEEADAALERGLSDVIFEGSEDDLKRTENTQPAILTTSIATWRALRQERPEFRPRFVAGHSLGEWSALVAAGSLAFADAVRLVQLRGRFMQEAVPEGEGGMSAIIGLDPGTVRAACAEAAEESGLVVAEANLNSGDQVVISGALAAVELAGRKAESRGAKKVVALPVSAPFHCPLMQPAADRLAEVLEPVEVHAPACPVVSNVEATGYDQADRIKALLVKQVTAPVRWHESVAWMAGEGVESAIEVGPGRVLAGLVRRIDRKLKVLGTDDPAAFQRTLESL
jgi:[acyl-carrier-protein] S-malonyltransferase